MISKKRLKKQAYNFMYNLKRELKKFNHEIEYMEIEAKNLYLEIDSYTLNIKIDEKGLTDEAEFSYVEIIIESYKELASDIDKIIDKIESNYELCENCNDYFHDEYEPCECVYDDPVAEFLANEWNALVQTLNRR